MRAETVSVGTEILLGQITDTNAVELGRVYAECGIGHTHRQTVGDNLERLTESLRLALSRSDVVVTIGGLGPTEDDLTRDGIAAALDDPLVHDPEVEAALRALFERRRLVWLDSQIRQAFRPTCSETVGNPNGTAPGLVCRKNGKTVIAMPGPKPEFVPMLEGPVRRILLALGDGGVIRSRTVRIAGMGESVVEDRLRDLMRQSDPTVAPYAKIGEVHLRMTAKRPTESEADSVLDGLEREIVERLGDVVYAIGDRPLEAVVLDRLRETGKTLATAESCTGGGISHRLTAVPGSSDVFLGGVVSYADSLKRSLLGVSPATLDTQGAVSEACAKEMADGIRRATGADYGISVTGIAGPGGGTEEKPVGLVWTGLATPEGTRAFRNDFLGDRQSVRQRSVQAALTALWTSIRAS
ncbi:MAG: competence/damage-inducible protein A [Armatimonadetes bacterium]|nr:competence/damage-inducible protein A [Armatimonadota bacterium]